MEETKIYTVADVLKALTLCGEEYHDGACQECPFEKDCMGGETSVLLVAAKGAIRKVMEELVEAREKLEALTVAAGDKQ